MKYIVSVILTSVLFLTIGCGNSKEVETKTENQVKVQSEKLNDGHPSPTTVDYYASAEDNSWKLSIRFDEGIVFTDTKNNISFSSNSIEKSVAQGANVILIASENDTHIIHVTIDIVECLENGKRVDIMLRKTNENKGRDYSGCGYYRGTPQLHDIWALYKLNGKELTAKQFPRELPHFEFNLVTKQMSGFAGCNQVNGNLSFEYNKVIIDNLAATRMYCGEASNLENEILSILRSKPIYQLKNLHLTLETTEGSITLKKVD